MATVQIPIPLVVPDSSGVAYPLLIAGTAHRHLVPAFGKDAVGDWSGIVTVPQDYSSGAKVVLKVGANATTGVTTMGVATVPVADGETYNPAAYTSETDQDVTVPATAYFRKDVTFTLTPTVAAEDALLVRIRHNGTAVNDTLAVDTVLFEALFEYLTA